MKIQNRHIPALLFGLFLTAAAGLFCYRNGPVLIGADPVLMVDTGVEADHAVTSDYAEPRFPLNINEASPEELVFLPGIGAETARAIVQYRAEHGAFSRAEELLEVSGIGQAKLEEILPYITLGG